MLWVTISSASGASNEYPQHLFPWRNKKNYEYFWVDFLRPFYLFIYFFIFIDHKSRMTKIDSFKFHFSITCL